MNQKPPDLSDPGITEKLQLVDDLWDEIASRSDSVPVHSWQKKELARRKAARHRNPGAALTWDDAKARAREQRG